MGSFPTPANGTGARQNPDVGESDLSNVDVTVSSSEAVEDPLRALSPLFSHLPGWLEVGSDGLLFNYYVWELSSTHLTPRPCHRLQK